MDVNIQQGKIIQRYHQILDWIFVGCFAIFFFSGQFVMTRGIESFTARDWWIPGGIELVGFLFLAIPSAFRLYFRYIKGEVAFERNSEKRTVKMNDEYLAGDWYIWREVVAEA